MTDLRERFSRLVHFGDDCWEWQGQISDKGYGLFEFRGVRYRAHRLSWELNCSPVPTGLYVCHHCDNRRCVRPSHLFLGTALDNARDAARKGRMSRRHRRGRAKLTFEQARAIRETYHAGGVSQRALAARYGLGQSTVRDIVNGTTWRETPLSEPSNLRVAV